MGLIVTSKYQCKRRDGKCGAEFAAVKSYVDVSGKEMALLIAPRMCPYCGSKRIEELEELSREED